MALGLSHLLKEWRMGEWRMKNEEKEEPIG
jgi:hypothetical protein